jgi:hypothetical protein
MTVFIHKGAAPLPLADGNLRGLRLLEQQLQPWEREQLSTVTADTKPLLSYANLWAASNNPDLAAFGRALIAEGSYTYAAFSNQWYADNQVNAFNGAFNWNLAAYRQAVARLSRYQLSVGCPEITEQQPDPDGAVDVNGQPVVVTVVTQPAVAPLPTTVDTVDGSGNLVSIPNPAIVQDEAERAAARATLDRASAEVKAWAS